MSLNVEDQKLSSVLRSPRPIDSLESVNPLSPAFYLALLCCTNPRSTISPALVYPVWKFAEANFHS